MAGLRIRELCAGLAVYRKALATDSVAARKVEVAVVAFGGKVQTLCDFTLAGEFRARNSSPAETPRWARPFTTGSTWCKTESTSTGLTASPITALGCS